MNIEYVLKVVNANKEKNIKVQYNNGYILNIIYKDGLYKADNLRFTIDNIPYFIMQVGKNNGGVTVITPIKKGVSGEYKEYLNKYLAHRDGDYKLINIENNNNYLINRNGNIIRRDTMEDIKGINKDKVWLCGQVRNIKELLSSTFGMLITA